MKIFIKILKSVIVIALITVIFIDSAKNNIYASAQVVPEKQVKAAVLLFSFDDPYISLVRESLEEIQNKNKNNVNFTFYDGKRNQDVQNALIDSVLQSNYDLLLVNLVNLDQNTVESVIYKAKQKNIPIILFNTVPFEIGPIKSYSKAIVIATDAENSGLLQGKAVATQWSSINMDKDRNNILQYIILKGPTNHPVTIARTNSFISAVNSAGIKSQQLESRSCNWDEECANDFIQSLFLKYDGRIEAIIANNDAMAIGAIKALQKYGYNKGDKTKTIPVFGIDAIPESRKLIHEGFMSGTVVQYPNEMAQALYTVGVNLVNNKNPLEGTNYKFDETGVVIKMPYYEYKSQKQ